MHKHLPVSISIISFNEEENIGRTLESIKDIASEIIVIDSHSTDRTKDIAKSHNAKVYEEDWKGYVEQKNSALEKCTQEWILSLDCDEVVSKELKKSIINAITQPGADGYCLNRKTYYSQKLLKHVWQPNWKLRLVRRSANPQWSGYDPHDILKIDGTSLKLKGDLFHYTYKDVEDHFKKTIKYSKLAAHSYNKDGKKFKWYKLVLNPVSGFVKIFILQKGFLDGYHGLIVAASSFIYTFLKYVFLWEIELRDKND